MKIKSLLHFCAFICLGGVLSIGSQLLGQEQKPDARQSPDPVPETQPRPTDSAGAPSEVQAQSFTGKIAKIHGAYLLKDEGGKSTYQLDDQKQAKDFDGEHVRVTGALDSATNTIYVTGITPI